MHTALRSAESLLRVVLIGVLLAGCARGTPPDAVPPHVEVRLYSSVLGELRRMNVWLPPGYDDGDARYPLLVMPDGGVEEDFPHVANTLAELIDDGVIAPLILVGIENTDRRRDLSPASSTEYDRHVAPVTDGAAAFRAFVRDELIPDIELHFRTDGRRAIVGESLAGLFVADTLVREPALFQRYIAIDPSLWWDDHRLVRDAPATFAALDGTERHLFFAGSDLRDIAEQTEALAQVLQAHAPAALRWTYVPKPEENHGTIFRATKEQAFRWALWPAG